MAAVHLTQLYHLENDPQIIHRIVRPNKSRSCEGGDIETVLFACSENGSQRIVIRDRDTVHVEMEVRDDSASLDQKNRMCWTKFEDMDQSVLCVLSSPTQVRLWDSGSFLGGGEGTTVHLPCEATSIFPSETGILVQRRFAADDNEDQEDDDLLFISKTTASSPPLSSLFSLMHPLKTLLPVENSSIMEQLVFVGVVDETQIAVTFHVDLRRHAVWAIHDAKPAPARSQHVKVNAAVTSFIAEEDLLREDGSFYEGVPGVESREQALADALGVGPRLGGEPMLGSAVVAPFGMTVLHPDITMTLMYEALPQNPEVTQDIFLAGNFLCLSTGEEVLVWSVDSKKVIPSARLPCACALPIKPISGSSRPETFIMILNNGIQLYHGGTFLVEVAHNRNEMIQVIRDSVGSRFTAELENGRYLRADLSFVLDPLSERVLTALQAAVGGEHALHMRMDCIRLMCHSANMTVGNPAWEALSDILKQVLGIDEGNSPETESSSWDMLVESEYYSTCDELFPAFGIEAIEAKTKGATSPFNDSDVLGETYTGQSTDDVALRTQVFDALHLLYEDLQMSVMFKPWGKQILPLLKGCLNDSMIDFYFHYNLDADSELSTVESKGLKPGERITSFERTPCISSWIIDCLSGQATECKPWLQSPDVAVAYPMIAVIQRAYIIMLSNGIFSDIIDINRDIAVVNALIEGGVTDEAFLQDNLPIGVAVPFLEVIARCRNYAHVTELAGVSDAIWKFVGREDMLDRNLQVLPFQSETKKLTEVDDDGLIGIEHSHALRFPNDNRLKEVSRLLRSSKPSFLKVMRAVEVSDHDHERLKQERLLTLGQRVLALPLGRGMFTIGTLRPTPAEQLPIAELCLSGRVPPTNGTLALDMTNTPPDMTMWPEFHNGVAAGLRLPAVGSKSMGSFKITRSWIIYNKASSSGDKASESNTQMTHAHGGLLMALGLRGHLSALSMTDIYEYLTQGSITTSVGVLLGMAANKRGTCDPSVSKMLCLHIPSLLPPSFSSIDVSAPAHAAAVAGIGLLYQGSSHRLMTEFLLNEMGRRPVHDLSTIDREAYTLSCGLALGMINLAKGGSGGDAGLADLEIEQRLYRYVVGGIDDRAAHRQQDTADRRLNTNGSTFGEGERCSRVYEGDAINNDVTAPGALLALGLMYMKSSNKAVAAGLALPDTHFLLEYSRPDTLMLKVLARSLILWDEVDPSLSWIENQIPCVVRRAHLKMKMTVKKSTEVAMSILDQDADNETKKLNDSSQSINRTLQHDAGSTDQSHNLPGDFQGEQEVDRQSVRQIHAYIVAGSCFSIGLRFAGTGDPRAAKVITEKLLDFKAFRDDNDPLPVALRPEQPIVGMCLGMCAISLALVMAGTGDLESLRLFKAIRWRSDCSIRHGAHMTIAAAIGLLFVGGGLCTVGRSPADVAALVTAFFPRFPMNTTDNKYHLQALRHVYALAVRQRHVQAFDVDSKEGVCVQVEAKLRDSRVEPTQFTTPSLLTNTDTGMISLVVQSETYFPASLSIDDSNPGGFSIFLKNRKDVGDESRAKNTDLGFTTGGSQGHQLAGILRSGQVTLKKDCRCPEIAQPFCSGSLFPCVSVALSPYTLPVFALLGAAESKRTHSLSSDVAILQNYYQRFGRETQTDYFLAPDSAALIVEKLKHILLSGHPSHSLHGNSGKDTSSMDMLL